MKQCTKCKVDRPIDQFQTYWHSTQQKHRTRNECTECLYKQRNERKRLRRLEKSKLIQEPIQTEIIQPEVPELQPEVFENKPGYKQCRTCKEWKELNMFYLHKSKSKRHYLDCRGCCNKVEHEKAKKKREIERLENGGSFRHYIEPNRWYDEEQKESTFNILKAIGWSFNEEKGIWWKDGIKTSDGVFINVKKKVKIRKPQNYTGFRHEAFKYSKDIYDLRLKGLPLHKIASKYNTTAPTVSKIITMYKNSLNNENS